MTTVENERLAVVETKVDALQLTTNALDTKLDSVILYIAGQKGAIGERRRESQLVRWIVSVGVPALISIAGLIAGRVVH